MEEFLTLAEKVALDVADADDYVRVAGTLASAFEQAYADSNGPRTLELGMPPSSMSSPP